MDNLNGLYAHRLHISDSFNSALTDYKGYKGVLPCEGYDYEEDPVNLLECPFSMEE